MKLSEILKPKLEIEIERELKKLSPLKQFSTILKNECLCFFEKNKYEIFSETIINDIIKKIKKKRNLSFIKTNVSIIGNRIQIVFSEEKNDMIQVEIQSIPQKIS